MKDVLDKCLVVTFAQNERTKKLCDMCYEKLGLKNRIYLESPGGFHDKYLEFSDIVVDTNYEYYLRNDADRLVFSGIYELFNLMENDKDLSWVTGEYYDYIMDRFRGGTPTLHRRAPLIHLNKNKHMMKNVQKPEANYATSIKGKFKMKNVSVFTNLHEYEQYPSKVCNAFLNRLGRNHYPQLYNNEYLNNLPEYYKKAIHHAFQVFKKQGHKNSMVFQDFSFLDDEFLPIEIKDIESKYKTYLNLYNTLLEKYK